MQLFYLPDIESDTCFLEKEESRHCIKVLRYRRGDILKITNGKGVLAQARITEANPERCTVEISERLFIPKNNSGLHIAIAPTKNSDRLEWFAEKATEIGIDVITPVFCEHSERTTLNIHRLEKVVLSAMKQSLKSWLPVVNLPVSFREFISYKSDGLKFIAYCETGREDKLHNYLKNGVPVTIMIGPEGDFSTEEVRMAIEKGFIPVSLGESRLRTETAGLVACHTVRFMESLIQ